MTSVTIKRELPKEFLSDILITAFDGGYGSSWNWFEIVPGLPGGWLKTDEAGDVWLSAHVRLQEECHIGHNAFDSPKGMVIDHEGLADGISRIINDDYVGIWRPATEAETESWKTHGNSGIGQRHTRLVRGGLQVETGETARAYRSLLAECLSASEPDAGDIDADVADAIVQVAAFGKCIFG